MRLTNRILIRLQKRQTEAGITLMEVMDVKEIAIRFVLGIAILPVLTHVVLNATLVVKEVVDKPVHIIAEAQ